MHIVIFRRNFTGALHEADFSALRLQPVADAVDSAELVLPADLPAQALDVQIDHAAADRVFSAPDALIYRVAVERRAAVSHRNASRAAAYSMPVSAVLTAASKIPSGAGSKTICSLGAGSVPFSRGSSLVTAGSCESIERNLVCTSSTRVQRPSR